MTEPGPIRTALFLPGNRLDRLDKALATRADAVIVDLEDAVPPQQKAEAREGVAAILAQTGDKPVWVRINGLVTEEFQEDLWALTGETPAGFIVPKVESGPDMERIHKALNQVEQAKGLDRGRLPVIGLVETAKGVDRVSEVTRAGADTGRLYTLAFGAADYTMDLGIEMTPEGDELLYVRSRLPIACRAAGLEPPLDTPFMIDLKDLPALEADALRAKRLGFQGKLCIHPVQIDPVNLVFSPKPEEIQAAGKIIKAFEDSEARGMGAIQVDGRFVDHPVVMRARRIIRLAARLGLSEEG